VSRCSATNELEVPTFAALAQARSAREVRALPAEKRADEEDSVTLDFVNAMVLPPFWHSPYGADTEDPGELCAVACKTIRDLDIALRDPLVHADDQENRSPAEEFLTGIPKFLWAAAVCPTPYRPFRSTS
jgi:hypothetical protein